MKHLVDIKTYRNSIASISLLPDELLSQIMFQYVLATDPWSGGWTKVLFVCRRWHDVAMADAKLWSFVSDDHSSHSMRSYEWIQRSKQHPLMCKFSVAMHSTCWRDALPEEAHRLRSLSLSGSQSRVQRVFEGIRDFPILESLQLDAYKDSDDDDPDLWHIPSVVVNGGTPRLVSLKLSDIGFVDAHDWDHLVNLTHLQLERRSAVMRLPSLADLVTFLQGSPQLQTLAIRRYIEDSTVPLDHHHLHSSVTLSHLRHLDLNAVSYIVTAILECLVIPPTSSMYLVPHGIETTHGGPDDELIKLLRPIRLHLRHPDAPVLRSICLDSNLPDSHSSLSAHHETKCPHQYDFDSHPHISLITYPETQSDLRKILTKVLHAFPLNNMTYVYAPFVMKREKQLSPQTWTRVFSLLPMPLTIEMGVNDGMVTMLEGFLDAMRKSSSGSGGGKSKRRRQPASSLQLYRLNLLASYHPEALRAGQSDEEQTRLYARLISLLSEYRDLDIPSKAGGISTGTVSVDSILGGFTGVYAVRDELFAVVDQLIVKGKVYDPVAVERQRAEMREMVRKYEESFSPRDENV